MFRPREYKWASSIAGDPAVLAAVERQMHAFYDQKENRSNYQSMLDESDGVPLRPDDPGTKLLDAVLESNPNRVLEVGCGAGRVYKWLRAQGYAGIYVGVELAEYIIDQNRRRFPEADWKVGSAYALPADRDSMDVVFSYYVLEHCVRPRESIAEMIRVTRPGGQIVLLFPDFLASGRFASQQTGLTPGLVRDKLKAGRWIDAAVTAFDSRFRLPLALRNAKRKLGAFPINLDPLCLHRGDLMWADIDAVYIADKFEVTQFARTCECAADFPEGTKGLWAANSLVRLTKSG